MRTRIRGEGEQTTVIDVVNSGSALSPVISFIYPYYVPRNQNLTHFDVLGYRAVVGVDFMLANYNASYWSVQFLPTLDSAGQAVSPVSPGIGKALASRALALASVPSTPTAALVSVETEIMNDVVTPRFRERVNAGEIINNPMDIEYSYVYNTPRGVKSAQPIQVYRKADTSAPGNNKQFNATVSYSYNGYVVGFTPSMFPDCSSQGSTAELDAVSNVYAKLQSAELDVALMAAEGKETLTYIRQLCRRIMRLIELATNRKTLAKAAKKTWQRLRSRDANYAWEAKGIAEAWLEVRYAIRPLMYDIADAIEYFNEGNKRTGKRTTFRSKVSVSDTRQTVTTIGSMTLSLDLNISTTARAGVLADRALTSKVADFGFLNLAGVAWDKVKLSFILDWIINISGILYRLNPTATWVEKAAWVKVTQMVSFSGTITLDSPDGIISVPIMGSRRSVHRAPVSGPPLTFISVNLDTFKMLDLIALARNMRGNSTSLRL